MLFLVTSLCFSLTLPYILSFNEDEPFDHLEIKISKFENIYVVRYFSILRARVSCF